MKVNKAALARVLPWSLSTLKRAYREMLEKKIIAEHPDRAGEYTICDAADLVVPEGMKKTKSGSSMDEIGSSVEMPIGSNMEMIGSSVKMIGSNMEMIGSSMDIYTHYKPFDKAIHKHHSLTAPPVVVSACAHAADAARSSAHQDTSRKHDSSTVPVQEHACQASFPDKTHSLQQSRHRITTLENLICGDEQKIINEQLTGIAHWIVTEELTIEALRTGWSSTSADEIITAVLPILQKNIDEHGSHEGWSPEACELVVLRSAEIIAGAFLLCNQDEQQLHPQFKHCWNAVWSTYQALPIVGNHPDAKAQDKAESLMREIRGSNKNGWPTYSRGEIEYKLSTSSTVHKGALEFFKEHEDVCTHDVWKAMSDCVEVHQLNDKPQGFDPLWKARKGINPAFLFKYWDDIIAEVEAAEILVS